jgi:phosphoribosylformimino-5-aminoimidazole carboxamide ribotide isomerase
MIIYPAIDILGGQCVRLRQGRFEEATTYAEDPVEMALRWQAEGAQWLHVVDLDGSRLGNPQPQTLAALQRIIAQVGLPIQLGGGIRNADIVEQMLGIGVARVVVGTAAARDAALAETLFTTYGDQIAAGVDARDGIVAIQGWQEASGEAATAYVRRMAALGARRFIFTDIGRDGMLQGVNIQSLSQVAAAIPNLPLIASGGVTTLNDVDALRHLQTTTTPNIEGVIIGKALYAGTVTLSDILARAAAAPQ